jgi:DNA polymerase
MTAGFGFFPASVVLTSGTKKFTEPLCDSCLLYRGCHTPKMGVFGQGKREILLVGNHVSEEDDAAGRPFSGDAGQVLRSTLALCGVDLEKDCWSTNATICGGKGKSSPDAKKINYCRPNLIKAIRTLQPKKIILLGGAAIRSCIGEYYRQELGEAARWVGWKIPLQEINTWVCPTYSPSQVMLAKDEKAGAVYRLWFERHIQAAIDLEGRPWDPVPDYAAGIKIIKDLDKAAQWIRKLTASKLRSSFDYETNCLKPDNPAAKIRTVAFHCIKGTMACPVLGPVIEALIEYVESPNEKVGANTKFEDRWSRRFLGVKRVNGFVWDTQLSAHHLDNRRGINSVEFQSFVRLGTCPWDAKVSPYFDSEDSVSLNRVYQVDLDSLLLYTGIDAIDEFLIAEKQQEEMKWQNQQ